MDGEQRFEAGFRRFDPLGGREFGTRQRAAHGGEPLGPVVGAGAGVVQRRAFGGRDQQQIFARLSA